MVAMDMAQEDEVDLAEPGIVGPENRAPGIVEDPRAVGILEQQGAVVGAELAVMGAERRDLDLRRRGRLRRGDREGGDEQPEDRYAWHGPLQIGRAHV